MDKNYNYGTFVEELRQGIIRESVQSAEQVKKSGIFDQAAKIVDYEKVKNLLILRLRNTEQFFIPEVAKRIYQLMGNGYYLVFTSVHELMVHNDKTVDSEDLSIVLRLRQTMEEAIPWGDRLTTHVYYYDEENGFVVAV